MLDGVFPTAARATYCPVIFPLKLKREVLLAQPSEIQTQSKHGITQHAVPFGKSSAGRTSGFCRLSCGVGFVAVLTPLHHAARTTRR